MKDTPIVIYKNWLAMFTAMPSDQVGDLMKAISMHVIVGAPVVVSPSLQTLADQIVKSIDGNLDHYTKKCERNKKIAEEREAKRAEEEHERDTNVQRTCNECDTDVSRTSGKTKTKTKTKTNNLSNDKLESEGASNKSKPSPSRFIPPTLEEVKAYVLEKGLEMDAEEFYDYYTAIGWKVGKSPMRDWKAAARNWARRDKKMKPTATPIKKTGTAQDALDRMRKELEESEQINLAVNGSVLTGLPGTVQ